MSVKIFISVKAISNRCVFRTDLKFSRDDAFLIFTDSLFHKLRTARLYTQSPNDLNLDTAD